MKGAERLFFVILYVSLLTGAMAQDYQSVLLSTRPLSLSGDGNGKICVGERFGTDKQIVRYDKSATKELLIADKDVGLVGLTLFNGRSRVGYYDQYNSIACDKVGGVSFFGFGPEGQPNIVTKPANQPLRVVIGYSGPVPLLQLPENTISRPLLNDALVLYIQSGHTFVLANLVVPGASKATQYKLDLDLQKGMAKNLSNWVFNQQNAITRVTPGCFTENNFWTPVVQANGNEGFVRLDKNGVAEMLLSGSFHALWDGISSGIACNENTAVLAIKDAKGYKFLTFKEGYTSYTTASFDSIDGVPMAASDSHQLTDSGELLFTMSGSLFRVIGQQGQILKPGTTAPAGIITQTVVSGNEIFYLSWRGGFNGPWLYALVKTEIPPPPPVPEFIPGTVSRITDLYGQDASAAPGKIMTIWGTGLCPVRASTSLQVEASKPLESVTLPKVLGGCQVRVDDQLVSLYYAGTAIDNSSQINFILPENLSPGPHAAVVEKMDGNVDGNKTAPFKFTSVETSPMFFHPQNYPITLQIANRGSITLVSGDNPAKAGDILTAYSTGLGQGKVSITINDRDAKLDFAGPQPAYPGLDQYNFTVPSEVVPVGGLGSLKITVGGKVQTFPFNLTN